MHNLFECQQLLRASLKYYHIIHYLSQRHKNRKDNEKTEQTSEQGAVGSSLGTQNVQRIGRVVEGHHIDITSDRLIEKLVASMNARQQIIASSLAVQSACTMFMNFEYL